MTSNHLPAAELARVLWWRNSRPARRASTIQAGIDPHQTGSGGPLTSPPPATSPPPLRDFFRRKGKPPSTWTRACAHGHRQQLLVQHRRFGAHRSQAGRLQGAHCRHFSEHGPQDLPALEGQLAPCTAPSSPCGRIHGTEAGSMDFQFRGAVLRRQMSWT